MRKLIAFPCAGETLVGTLDDAAGTTGLLIVSGGNEIRIGAHRGMALLAERVARADYPVLRFDRRGIGDSTGENRGFESSDEDIAAAAAAFRETGVERIVAYGNCDAATALAFFHAQAGIDALILANPWAVEPSDEMPPAAAIRSHYAAKLRDPREWLRAARGGVDIAKLARGLAKISKRPPRPAASLASRLAAALPEAQVPVTILLAKGDNTAIAFADAFKDPAFDAARGKVTIEQLDSASHSFASAADKHWLLEKVLKAL
ncbi:MULTISPECIES: hydrolase 1, exosortase A system-associated [Sphingomonas]|uniref:hydrolase 1, exosortase A system-associated n=1 Tax=Sphingomonas TaxID=13687 RepID=UPI00095CF2A8|nr:MULTISPECIES: hydrolase 1, exosortase A system-associated [unclassified Sphingomonas]MBN8811582.1 hydrolase 1, exosortase A system-associated [Sphingomonas sp.]OJY49826.1 MAG: hydrolase 1, exosortase A system-associated [Sphingomonas sp. 67-41]